MPQKGGKRGRYKTCESQLKGCSLVRDICVPLTAACKPHPILLDVTCCVRLHTLLHVVGSCCANLETGQTFGPTTPNISFVP